MFEQYGSKMNKMALQKQEIQENVKKLQLLTQDYAVFIDKEDQIKLAEADIANQRKALLHQQAMLDKSLVVFEN